MGEVPFIGVMRMDIRGTTHVRGGMVIMLVKGY